MKNKKKRNKVKPEPPINPRRKANEMDHTLCLLIPGCLLTSYAIMHHIYITFQVPKCNFAEVEVKAPWEPTITLHLWIMDLGFFF